MQNGNSKDAESGSSQQKPIKLSELSFADIAKRRREKELTAGKGEEQKTEPAVQAEKSAPDVKLEEKPPLIELRDDIDVTADFCKIPNSRWKIAPLQDPKEYCVYDYLYRLSYGWRRNVCRVGYGAIAMNTSVGSKSAAIRAIEGLMEKFHIIRLEEDRHTKKGSLYRILSPEEILSGIFKLSIVKLSIVKLSISKSTISALSIVKMTIVKKTAL